MTKNVVMSPAFLAEIKSIVRDAVREAFTDNEARNSLLTSGQVQQLFGISRTTLWRLQKECGLEVHRLPNRRGNLYSAEQVKSLISVNE